MLPRCSSDAPKLRQDASKMTQRMFRPLAGQVPKHPLCPICPARWLQVPSRWPKMRPKMAKMRAKNAWMRPMIAKMKLKMAMMGPLGAS